MKRKIRRLVRKAMASDVSWSPYGCVIDEVPVKRHVREVMNDPRAIAAHEKVTTYMNENL